MNRLTIVFLLLPLFSYAAEDEIAYRSVKSESFKYLEYMTGSIQSTHAIRISLKIPVGYRSVEPSNHFLIFNNSPYNVSVAALVGENSVIFVHAEHAVDDSGVLDYSSLPYAQIGELQFHWRSDCIEPSEALIQGHHDFRYLRQNGFEPLPAMYMKQFMRNTQDLKSEYIVTYSKRVDGCSEEIIDEQFVREIDEQIQILLSMSEL